MAEICVRGGRPLSGSARVCGAKNAVLPILGAALMTSGETLLYDVPSLTDVSHMLEILKSLGCSCEREGGVLRIDASRASKHTMPEDLSKVMRSSIFMLGPVIARFSKAVFTFPGGCAALRGTERPKRPWRPAFGR